MSHVFDRYFRKHGHYPRIQVDNGVQRLTVEFAPGYVRIKTSPPFGGEVYLTANTCRALLRQRSTILSLLKRQDRSFDVPKRVHDAYLLEISLDREKRALKKSHSEDPAQRERQRRRWLAARRRASL